MPRLPLLRKVTIAIKEPFTVITLQIAFPSLTLTGTTKTSPTYTHTAHHCKPKHPSHLHHVGYVRQCAQRIWFPSLTPPIIVVIYFLVLHLPKVRMANAVINSDSFQPNSKHTFINSTASDKDGPASSSTQLSAPRRCLHCSFRGMFTPTEHISN